MDETEANNSESNTNPTDEEEMHDDFPASPEEQIQWLRNHLTELMAHSAALTSELEVLRNQLAESPIPSPDSIAEMITAVLEPEITAIKKTVDEMKQSTDTPAQTPETSETPKMPLTDEEQTEPQEKPPVESPAPEVEEAPAPALPAAPEKPRRRVVKV